MSRHINNKWFQNYQKRILEDRVGRWIPKSPRSPIVSVSRRPNVVRWFLLPQWWEMIWNLWMWILITLVMMKRLQCSYHKRMREAAITVNFGDRRLHISMQCSTVMNLEILETFLTDCDLRKMWSRPRAAKWFRSFAKSFKNPMWNFSSCAVNVEVSCLSKRYYLCQDWLPLNIYPSQIYHL